MLHLRAGFEPTKPMMRRISKSTSSSDTAGETPAAQRSTKYTLRFCGGIQGTISLTSGHITQGSGGKCPGLCKRQQSAAFLIPKVQSRAAEAFPKRDASGLCKDVVILDYVA